MPPRHTSNIDRFVEKEKKTEATARGYEWRLNNQLWCGICKWFFILLHSSASCTRIFFLVLYSILSGLFAFFHPYYHHHHRSSYLVFLLATRRPMLFIEIMMSFFNYSNYCVFNIKKYLFLLLLLWPRSLHSWKCFQLSAAGLYLSLYHFQFLLSVAE